jgi:microcystin-dependent protein
MEAFLGIILPSPYNFAPKNWAFCSGQVLAISQNAALFTLLGTNFGGNGVTTFGLPDLRGRVIIGSNAMGVGPGLTSYNLGAMSGTETVTLLTSQLPAHVHPNQFTGVTGSMATSSVGTTNTPSATAILGVPSGTTHIYGNPASAGYSLPVTVNVSGSSTTGIAGGSQPTPIMQPFTALCYIIALSGIFPTRG